MTVTSAPDKAPDRIARMFDAIAPRYDLLNHVLSAGIDKRWRARAIESLHLTGRETVLDVCTGTADVALEACRGGPSASATASADRRSAKSEGWSSPPGAGIAARVVGVDFAGAMLALGRRKVAAAGESNRISLLRGDAMRLPARDASVDAVTVAFGIRNVQRPEVACTEMARTLKPGGRLAILEFGVPRIPGLRAFYLWYFRHVLPRIGRVVSGHNAAYSYLPASVGTFPPPDEFMRMLSTAGFVDVRADPLTFGIVFLYTGRKG